MARCWPFHGASRPSDGEPRRARSAHRGVPRHDGRVERAREHDTLGDAHGRERRGAVGDDHRREAPSREPHEARRARRQVGWCDPVPHVPDAAGCPRSSPRPPRRWRTSASSRGRRRDGSCAGGRSAPRRSEPCSTAVTRHAACRRRGGASCGRSSRAPAPRPWTQRLRVARAAVRPRRGSCGPTRRRRRPRSAREMASSAPDRTAVWSSTTTRSGGAPASTCSYRARCRAATDGQPCATAMAREAVMTSSSLGSVSRVRSAAASAAGSSAATAGPCARDSRASRRPPASVPSTGVPHARDSRTTRPNPSRSTDGTTVRSAATYQPRRASSSTRPQKRTDDSMPSSRASALERR